MAVDVSTRIVIERSVSLVFSYAADPSNATEWYVNIKAVEWETPPPLSVGSRVRFVAESLGRRIAYTYEIRELKKDTSLVMTTAEGPFPMETSYQFAVMGPDQTEMTLRNRGTPTGFSTVIAPFIGAAMRHANRKDLRRLKRRIEERFRA